MSGTKMKPAVRQKAQDDLALANGWPRKVVKATPGAMVRLDLGGCTLIRSKIIYPEDASGHKVPEVLIKLRLKDLKKSLTLYCQMRSLIGPVKKKVDGAVILALLQEAVVWLWVEKRHEQESELFFCHVLHTYGKESQGTISASQIREMCDCRR